MTGQPPRRRGDRRGRRSDMLADIVGLPEHLRDALWKVESAQPPAVGLARAASSSPAWAARRSAARSRARCSATTPRARCSPSRAYGLPAWTTPDTTVLCASYSGDTEETLACYEAAGALGARASWSRSGGRLAELARADGVPVIPVAGGFQPRAAVAYMTVAALEVAGLCGAGPRMGSEIDVAADHLEQLVVEWGADGAEDCEAKALARALHDSVAGDRRLGPHDADRLPLEDAVQREREDPRVHARAARARPQRDRRLAGAPRRSGASPRSSSTTATRIRACRSASR